VSPDELLDELLDSLQSYLESGGDLDEELAERLNRQIEGLVGEIESAGELGIAPPPTEPPITGGALQRPQGVELLWILSNGDINAFVDYLRTYPGKGLLELSESPDRLLQVIEYLQKNNPISELPSEDEIPNVKYRSSNVIGMKYDMNGNVLVKFFGNGKSNPIYRYSNVPNQVIALLEEGNAFARTQGSNSRGSWWKMKNPSIGAAVNQYLKEAGYPYQKVA